MTTSVSQITTLPIGMSVVMSDLQLTKLAKPFLDQIPQFFRRIQHAQQTQLSFQKSISFQLLTPCIRKFGNLISHYGGISNNRI
jgi:hypothetical protein